MPNHEKQPSDAENLSPEPGNNNNDQTAAQANLKTEDNNNTQRAREEEYAQIYPEHAGELRDYLENDNHLSDEEIATVMDESEAENQQRQHLEDQREQLAELEKSTGFQLNTDDINFMLPDDTLTELSMLPEYTNPAITPVNDQELPKVDIQPSYLFTKDNEGEVKVVSQNQDGKSYQLDKTNSKEDVSKSLPKVFLNKGVLENFIENFFRAHAFTEGTIKHTGEKLSELIRGKVDLILVDSAQGYDKSLQMAKAYFSENHNINQNNPVNQNPTTKFQENQVNWSSLEKIGISKERLQATGQLSKFLNGEKTSLIEPSSLKEGNKYPFGNTPFKLYLEPGLKGVENKLIFKEPKLRVQDEYEGHKLSVEDKLSLITKGHLGRLMEINGKPHFVSVDRELNIIGHREASTLKIPAQIKLANGNEIQLNKEQQQLLTQGKSVPLADLKDSKGQSFSGQLIVNASSGKLDLMREVPASVTQKNTQSEVRTPAQGKNEVPGRQRTPDSGGAKIGL